MARLIPDKSSGGERGGVSHRNSVRGEGSGQVVHLLGVKVNHSAEEGGRYRVAPRNDHT